MSAPSVLYPRAELIVRAAYPKQFAAVKERYDRSVRDEDDWRSISRFVDGFSHEEQVDSLDGEFESLSPVAAPVGQKDEGEDEDEDEDEDKDEDEDEDEDGDEKKDEPMPEPFIPKRRTCRNTWVDDTPLPQIRPTTP